MTICLGDCQEEAHQLQSLGIFHVHGYLFAALSHGVPKLYSALAFLLFKEAEHNLLTLILCLNTETRLEEIPHHLHLGMHHLAVGLDDV